MTTITTGSIAAPNLTSGSYTLSPNTTNIFASTTALPYTITTGTGGYTFNSTQKSNARLELEGENADIKINGKSLCRAIEKIEERLAILHPNPMLEKKWEDLKQLGDQYRKLEAEIIEKEKIWKILEK